MGNKYFFVGWGGVGLGWDALEFKVCTMLQTFKRVHAEEGVAVGQPPLPLPAGYSRSRNHVTHPYLVTIGGIKLVLYAIHNILYLLRI